MTFAVTENGKKVLTMAEYIERETAVSAVMAAKWVDGSDGAMAMEIVASPPAADVAPVRHGRWQGSSGDTCSVCGEECFDWSNMRAFLYPYCPYCNTKMDGVDDG